MCETKLTNPCVEVQIKFTIIYTLWVYLTFEFQSVGDKSGALKSCYDLLTVVTTSRCFFDFNSDGYFFFNFVYFIISFLYIFEVDRFYNKRTMEALKIQKIKIKNTSCVKAKGDRALR